MNTGVMTRVTIFDREYSVLSDLKSEYLLQLAEYIDKRMREIAEVESNISMTRLAVLALLQITDELFQTNKNKQDLIGFVDEKISQIIDIIDKKNTGVIS